MRCPVIESGYRRLKIHTVWTNQMSGFGSGERVNSLILYSRNSERLTIISWERSLATSHLMQCKGICSKEMLTKASVVLGNEPRDHHMNSFNGTICKIHEMHRLWITNWASRVCARQNSRQVSDHAIQKYATQPSSSMLSNMNFCIDLVWCRWRI